MNKLYCAGIPSITGSAATAALAQHNSRSVATASVASVPVDGGQSVDAAGRGAHSIGHPPAPAAGTAHTSAGAPALSAAGSLALAHSPADPAPAVDVPAVPARPAGTDGPHRRLFPVSARAGTAARIHSAGRAGA